MKMSKKIIRILLVTLVVVISLFYLYSKGTYTAYETKTEGKITPSIAKWNIKVDGFTVTSSEVKTIGLSNITWNSNNAVSNKAVPGSTGVAKITIDPVDTDVAIKYTIEVVDKDIDDTKFLDVIDIKDNNNTLIQTGVNTYVGIITLEDVKAHTVRELTLDVEWPLGEDIDPTSSDVNSSSNFLLVNFLVEQYKGETIIPYAG